MYWQCDTSVWVLKFLDTTWNASSCTSVKTVRYTKVWHLVLQTQVFSSDLKNQTPLWRQNRTVFLSQLRSNTAIFLLCNMYSVTESCNLSNLLFQVTQCVIYSNDYDSPANDLAWSVETARKCFRSFLFPTSMTTMLASAWSRNSFSQRSTFSNVRCLAISYTTKAPTAPR